MKYKKIIITIVVILAVVLLGTKGKGLLEKRKQEVANEPLPITVQISVELAKAREGTLSSTSQFLAQINSDKSIKLSTKLAGFVKKVMVNEADEVKKGELLVTIDSVELKSNIDALTATLRAQINDANVAQKIYSRNKKLYRVGGLPKEKLELSKVAYEAKVAMVNSTKEKIAQLKHQLNYLKIRAPFDGIIDSVLLHEGDLAVAGKPIIAMSNQKQKLVFSFARSENIKKGQIVLYKNKKIGTVKFIYPTSKNGLISAEVALDKRLPLPIGASINIEVLTKSAKGCILPADTLLHKKDGTYVMVYNGKSFIPLKVNVEIETKDKVIVSPCPKYPVARGSEVKLSKLQAYNNVNIIGDDNAK